MENAQRIADMLREEGLDWVALSGADAVTFATGHVVPIEIGQSPFNGGPTMAFVSCDGAVGIVAPNVEGAQVEDATYGLYSGFANEVVPQKTNFLSAAQEVIEKLGVAGKIGIEGQTHPASTADLLTPGRDLKTPLDRLRAVKTKAEIALLRHSGNVAAAGQMTARAVSQAGKTELTAWNEIRSTMENMAGSRCALAGEYIATVARTAQLGLPVSDAASLAGEPIVCDLAPRVNGYWGDSCSSFILDGQPSKEYLDMWNAARGALGVAMDILKPGLRISEFDAQIRGHVQKLGFEYPHHSGHGVGTSVHEWPRLVPDEDALIEENMVLMVEPGSYVEGLGGLRTEYMLRVTATGCENLTDFVLEPTL